MSKLVLILSFCLVSAYCAVFLEDAPVSDQERAQGFACKSSNENLGLMKDGESRKNYEPNLCSQARCGGGQISYATCGIAVKEGCELVKNSKKPYPECCMDFRCD